MDAHALEVLGWAELLGHLAAQADHGLGKAACLALLPEAAGDRVEAALTRTQEARTFLAEHSGALSGGIFDVSAAVQRAAKGAVLPGDELRWIGSTVKAGKRLKELITARAQRFPALQDVVVAIASLPELVARIEGTFGPDGEVRDDASPELARARGKMRDAQARARSTLQRMLTSHGSSLQDPIVAMRDGRFVLPVRADAKGNVPGLVHDASASGQTLYVEPFAVVELNNAWRQAQAEAEAEVQRILAELSEAVGAVAEPLGWSLEALGELEATFAKARLAELWGGARPRVNRHGVTHLKRARHPLLVASLGLAAVVPIDLSVGDPHKALLITGPNTGGKTAALKAMGLLTLMTQAGLHPPMAEDSVVGLVDGVYADIGDEQSLAQSLSTFSGHLMNLIRFLAQATRRSLVLLDELGAGTDPAEGAAIARAVVEAFVGRGARLVATTHHGQLKALRHELPGVEVAAVEFDLATLSPTYRMFMGASGSSNAIAIAERLGFPVELVQRAREVLAAGGTAEGLVLAQVEAAKLKAAEDRAEAQRLRGEAEGLKQRYEDKLAKWQDERRAREAEANRRLELRMAQAEGEINDAIRALQREGTAQAAQGAKQRLGQLQAQHEAKTKAPARAQEGPPREALSLGKRVHVIALGTDGKVASLPGGDGRFTVRVGAMTVKVTLQEVRLNNGAALSLAPEPKPEPKRGGSVQLVASPGLELDLRGLMQHEALPEADVYLDQAVRAGLREVRLVHGAGTGALRRALREWLRQHPHAKSFRPGELGEGGDGVTVVLLA